MKGDSLPFGKRFLAVLIATLIAMAVVAVVGELMVRFIRPQPSLHSRWQFSPKYGTIPPPDKKMVHERPGRWRFIYTTNANHCRGELIPVSTSYERQNVLVLGDSYSFGSGVNDDEVFAAVLSEELGDGYDTVNLAVGGWGLTQHIRRFYEFGQRYDPSVVILQFCENDPRDNRKNRVTTVENGKFVFHDSTLTMNFLKRYLSLSRIQRSQLYNFIRNSIYARFIEPTLTEAVRRRREANPDAVPAQQRFYNELLEAFASGLRERGITLIVISVDGQMSGFPFIEKNVGELNSKGLLIYCEVLDWFEGKPHPKSPEGHIWGRESHRIIGTELAIVIRDLD